MFQCRPCLLVGNGKLLQSQANQRKTKSEAGMQLHLDATLAYSLRFMRGDVWGVASGVELGSIRVV